MRMVLPRVRNSLVLRCSVAKNLSRWRAWSQVHRISQSDATTPAASAPPQTLRLRTHTKVSAPKRRREKVRPPGGTWLRDARAGSDAASKRGAEHVEHRGAEPPCGCRSAACL